MRHPEPDFSAGTRFPEIFTASSEAQKEIFERITRTIANFLHLDQLKFSWKRHLKPKPISHSLFCLKLNGEFRYFLSPHKNDRPEEKNNLLGKGEQASVIPGYELRCRDGLWHLLPEAEPCIALKIFLCSDHTRQARLERVKKEMDIMKKIYPDAYPFTEPCVRWTPKFTSDFFTQKSSHKIYLPMPYFPGKNGHLFWENKNPLNLDDFLDALRYCTSSIEEVDRLHRLELLHGDLKPSNFIFHQGKSRLIDFSFSRHILEKPLEGDGRTEAYAPRSLLTPIYHHTLEDEGYALGMTLYELLSGTDLFADLDRSKFTKQFKEKLPRIDPHFLDQVPIQDEHKQVLLAHINALVNYDPTARPPLPEVQKAFQKIVAEMEFSIAKCSSLNIWKTPEPEAPESPHSASTPTPSPAPYEK